MAEGLLYSEGQVLTRNGAQVLSSALGGAVSVPASPVTFTQTYSTAAATVPAATASAPTATAADVATTAATDTSPFGYAEAQANAIPVAINALNDDVGALITAVTALIADNLALRKTQNQIIDVLQALGVAL